MIFLLLLPPSPLPAPSALPSPSPCTSTVVAPSPIVVSSSNAPPAARALRLHLPCSLHLPRSFCYPLSNPHLSPFTAKPYTLLPFTPLKSTPSWAIPTKSNNVTLSRYSKPQTVHILKFCRLNHPNDPALHQKTLRRNIIIRSEILATGSPENVPYSITESKLGSRVRTIFFDAVTAVTAIPLFVMMVLVHPFVLLFDRYQGKAHHLIAKVWASMSIAPFYRFELERLENFPASDVPVVYVSNHHSFLDIYTLLTLGKNFKFISTRAVFVIPIVGWAMFLMGLIRLRRMDSRSQLVLILLCFSFFLSNF